MTWRALRQWAVSSRPTRSAVLRAIVATIVGGAAGIGLLVGAIGLLSESANRPGLAAVAGALIIIEIFAFLRSPLRFFERMSAHRVGLNATTTWRQAFMREVGAWQFGETLRFSTGDLLDRSLSDIDELQGIWIRLLLPYLQVASIVMLSDVVIWLLPHRHSIALAFSILVVGQLSIAGAIVVMSKRGAHADRLRRELRARFKNGVIELGAVQPELALLRSSHLAAKYEGVMDALAASEAKYSRIVRTTTRLAVVPSLLGTFVVLSFASSPVWVVVVAMILWSQSEPFSQFITASFSASELREASRRLENLVSTSSPGSLVLQDLATLRADNLSAFTANRPLFEHLNLSVSSGDRVVISGPSGSGKSTLLRLLAGLDSPESGSVLVNEHLLEGFSEVSLRSQLAYVPSEPALVRGYARDVLSLGHHFTHDPYALLSRLGMTVSPETFFEQLSRGEAQRVALVRALSHGATWFILDEPTSALGSAETAAVLEVLAEQNATYVIASHDPLVRSWATKSVDLAV